MVTAHLTWIEVLDAAQRIAFVWPNGETMLAEASFEKLKLSISEAKTSRRRLHLIIKGYLGHDVSYEPSLAAHEAHAARQAFAAWYTQAVQAQAALVRQRIAKPTF